MLEYLLSLIHSFICKTHSKITCYCKSTCCNKTNVDVPTKITKIINVITYPSKNNINRIKIPWRKVITA